MPFLFSLVFGGIKDCDRSHFGFLFDFVRCILQIVCYSLHTSSEIAVFPIWNEFSYVIPVDWIATEAYMKKVVPIINFTIQKFDVMFVCGVQWNHVVQLHHLQHWKRNFQKFLLFNSVQLFTASALRCWV